MQVLLFACSTRVLVDKNNWRWGEAAMGGRRVLRARLGCLVRAYGGPYFPAVQDGDANESVKASTSAARPQTLLVVGRATEGLA